MKSYILILFCLLPVLTGISQAVQPIIQGSHQSDIEFLDQDFEKDILLTADKKEFILWKATTGRQLRRVGLPYDIRGAALCSKRNEVAIAVYTYGKDASLRFFDALNGELIDSIRFVNATSYSSSFYSIDLLQYDVQTDRYLVKAFNDLFVIDGAKKKIIGQLQVPYDSKLAFTEKRDHFLFTYKKDNSYHVAGINSEGIRARDITLPPGKIISMSLRPVNGRFFLLNDKSGFYVFDSSLAILDSINLNPMPVLNALSTHDFSISSDGDKILMFVDKDRIVYDVSEKKWTSKGWDISYPDIFTLSSKEGMTAWKVSGKDIHQIDLGTGIVINKLEGKTYRLNRTLFSPSGKFLSISRTSSLSNYSDVLDLSTGIAVNDRYIDYGIYQWLGDSIVLAALPLEYDSKSYDRIHGLQIKNLFSGNVMQQIKPRGLNRFTDVAKLSNDRNLLLMLDQVENKVRLASGPGYKVIKEFLIPGSIPVDIGFSPDSKFFYVAGSRVRIYNISTGKWTELGDSTRVYGFAHIDFTPDSRHVWFQGSNSLSKHTLFEFDLKNNALRERRVFDSLVSIIRTSPLDDLYATGFFNGVVELRRISDDSLLFQSKMHNGVVADLIFEPKGNWVASSGDDGLLKIIDVKLNRPVVALAFLANDLEDRGFALVTPDNYYIVPPPLINELHFAGGYQTYSFAQFDLHLNRPDKVLQRIGLVENELLAMHQKAFTRRLNKSGLSRETLPDFRAIKPLKILNKESLNWRESEFILRLETDHDASQISQLKIYINGQLIETLKEKTSHWSVPLRLTAGKNNIEALYQTINGVESLKEKLEVTYQPPIPVMPKTYYIGIGVSRYQDSAMNLKYAVKDVTDIASRFRESDSNSIVHLFTDEAVNIKMLDYSMERHKKSVAESIYFIGQHKGLAIGNGMVFYLMHLIPVIGWIFAPAYAVIAATLSIQHYKTALTPKESHV